MSRWNGLCPAGKHGLDFKGQRCDLCVKDAEAKAVRALERLAKDWPRTLWLYAASGSLCVMRLDENGKRAVTPTGSYDQKYVETHVCIPCDGGDF